MKSVFVTGATGLLGPWLIEMLLEKKVRVVALVRDSAPDSLLITKRLQNSVTLVFGDLLDRDLLQRVLNEYDIDTVFHLGAQAIVGYANRSPISTFRSNIEGTWNLLEACRLSPWVKRIIVASSDKAYGCHDVLPYKEDAPLQGRYPYDVSKSCTDLIAQSYAYTYNLPVCITRCGNFFGGGDAHTNRIVPGTILSVLGNKNPVIRSDGTFVRDYIYVKDVAHAYITLAEQFEEKKLTGQCFNISTDTPYTVTALVETILELMHAQHLSPTILAQATNEIPAQHLCSEKMHSVLGWSPAYGVRKGLEETIAWYKEAYEKNLYRSSMLQRKCKSDNASSTRYQHHESPA